MKKIKSIFCAGFALIALVFAILLYLYFNHFDGDFSDYSNDWSNFSSFVSDIVVMCLTALNVWIFYKLTSTIAIKDDFQKKLQSKLSIQNLFRKALYGIFKPDEDNLTCDYNSNLFASTQEIFESLKCMSKIMPVCSSKSYEDFLKAYNDFCVLDLHGTPEEMGSTSLEQYAYSVLQKGRKVYMEMSKDIACYMTKEEL